MMLLVTHNLPNCGFCIKASKPVLWNIKKKHNLVKTLDIEEFEHKIRQLNGPQFMHLTKKIRVKYTMHADINMWKMCITWFGITIWETATSKRNATHNTHIWQLKQNSSSQESIPQRTKPLRKQPCAALFYPTIPRPVTSYSIISLS